MGLKGLMILVVSGDRAGRACLSPRPLDRGRSCSPFGRELLREAKDWPNRTRLPLILRPRRDPP